MIWTLGPWTIPGIAFFACGWTIAALVYRARPDRFQNRVLALALAMESLAWLFFAMLTGLTRPGDAWATRVVIHALYALLFPLYLVFLGTLDTPLSRVFASRPARAGLLGAGLAAAAFLVLNPRAFHPEAVRASAWDGWDAAQGPLADLLIVFGSLVFLYGFAVALTLFLRVPPRTLARRQAAIFVGAFGSRDLLFVASWVLLAYAPVPFTTPWVVAGTALQTVGLTVYVAFLGYGLLRHQLFDIDLKIKWTIKRSTLVALFVAFFFVVSELAAAVFTERVGPVLGILGAGLLLFAIAPLQRFADRVADTAMPGVSDTPPYRSQRRDEVYQGAIEELLADGAITMKERKTLFRLQRDLGLDAERARALEEGIIERLEGSGHG